MYTCSKCKLKVIVIGKEVIKVCTCNAPIVAEATATTKGAGGVKDK